MMTSEHYLLRSVLRLVKARLNNSPRATMSTALVDDCVATACNDRLDALFGPSFTLAQRRKVADMVLREFNYMTLRD